MTDAVSPRATDGAQSHGRPVRIVRAGLERLDDVRPLWMFLHDHHAAHGDPRLGPTRSAEESWPLRRTRYVEWLSTPDALFLIAEIDGRPIAYAVVRVVPGTDTQTWYAPDRRYEIETLAVSPEAHRLGVGKTLIDAIKCEARRLGIPALSGGIIAGNREAVRFYEREGGFQTYVLIEYRFDSEDPERVVEVPIADEREGR